MAAKRLEYLKSLKVSLNESKEDLVDESHQQAALERMHKIHIDIKKDRPIGRWGGGKRWTVHIVLLICEMLVTGLMNFILSSLMQSWQKKRLKIE